MTAESNDRYRPSPLGEVRTLEDGGRWTLVLVRDFAHPPDRVWHAITEPAALREWAPFDAPRSLATLGPLQLVMAGGDGTELTPAVVTRAEPPRLLEYTWDEDRLRWELMATPTGTRLTLSHTLADRSWLSRVAAGWHICLDVAACWLDGTPVGRIVGEAAKSRGWRTLNQAYAARLGVEAQPED
jgi:uncharacterized protein YndB with AHSA1/START domain